MCAVQYEKMGRVRSAVHTICFPAHVSHIALLPEVVYASAPVPICFKIREVCFDVNTTRSRHRSLSCGATRTFRNDAISGKRLTVLCDSDTPSVSVIRDGFASQHARLPCFPSVLNTVSFWSDLLLPEVCFDMHAAFSDLPGVWAARVPSVSVVSLLESLFQQLPWMLARHVAPVFHRYLVVSLSPLWPASVFLWSQLVSTTSSCRQHVCCLTSILISLHQLWFTVCKEYTIPPDTEMQYGPTTWAMRPSVRPTVTSTTTTRVTCSTTSTPMTTFSQMLAMHMIHWTRTYRALFDVVSHLIGSRSESCHFISTVIHERTSLNRFSSSTPILSFFLLHCELYSVLDNLIVMESLCHPANKGSCDVSTSLTSYEPNFMAFSELNDSSGSFSYIIPSSDQDMDDVHSENCLQRHTKDKSISVNQKACQSISRRCLSCSIDQGNLLEQEISTNQLVVVSQETRTVLMASFLKTPKLKKWSIDQGNLRSEIAQMHRLGLYLKNRDRWLSQNIVRKLVIMNSKQLMPKKSADFYKKNCGESKRIFEYSSTFNTFARRIRIKDQNTIVELSGREQEPQYEVNCMSDSKDFQDAESVRSGNSHVTSRPVFFPPHRTPEGMLKHSFGTHMAFFANPRASSSAPCPQEPLHESAAETSERPEQNRNLRCQSGPSATDSVIQWRMGRQTTNADFWSSRWQVPYTSNLCLLEDKVQDRGMYLFTISLGRSWLIQWMNWDLHHLLVILQCRILKHLMRGLLQHWTKSSIIPASKKNQSGGTKGPEAGPFPSRQTDCLLDLRLLSGHWEPWFCRKLHRPIHCQSTKWWYSGIRF